MAQPQISASTLIASDDHLVQPWRKWLYVPHTVEFPRGTVEDCHEARNGPCAALRLKSGALLFLNTGNGSDPDDDKSDVGRTM